MYTNPAFVRRGVGRMVLAACERAAHQEGFERLELMATMSGRPLYAACGFVETEPVTQAAAGDGVTVPCVRMQKSIEV
jgi:GNAT superfamily N-acetyltransferase